MAQVMQVAVNSQKATISPIFLMGARYHKQFLGEQFPESHRSFTQPEKLQYNLHNFVLVIQCILTNPPQKPT